MPWLKTLGLIGIRLLSTREVGGMARPSPPFSVRVDTYRRESRTEPVGSVAERV